MFGAQFLLRGQREIEQPFLVPHEDPALYRAIWERGWLDTVDHFGVDILGLQIDHTLTQVTDVGIGQVPHRAAFRVLGQFTQSQLYETDGRQRQQAGRILDDKLVKLSRAQGAHDERVHGDDLLIEVQPLCFCRQFCARLQA